MTSPDIRASDRSSRRGPSLRTRLVLLTTVALAVGLAIGGLVLTIVLRLGLERATDDAARQTAQEVVLLINSDRLPDPIPVGGTTVVQVVDQQGRVVAASSGADRLVPALPPDELAAALAAPTSVPGSRFGVQGPMRVVALPAGPPDAPSTVVVGAPAGDIDDAVRVARTSLIIGFLVLLVVLAAVAWRLVGATLRPVEALRAGAEKITGSGSADTLPLPNSADEIRRLAETLNEMLGRLDSSRQRQRAFVADAAHELRSPLTSLRTQLEVAVATGDEPDNADLLAEVDRLTTLVDDLLILARVDDARPPPREVVDIAALATDSAQRYTTSRVPVTVSTAPTPPVKVNRTAIDRVLANILDNAVRYATSAVTLAVGPGGDGALIVITDDGPGIPPGDRERVFERFGRLQDARDRDTGGSGLGLAIVRELIRQQGGTVTLGDAVSDSERRTGAERTADNEADADGEPGGPGLRVELRLPGARSPDTS